MKFKSTCHIHHHPPFPSPHKGSEYKLSDVSCLVAAEDEDVSTDEE